MRKQKIIRRLSIHFIKNLIYSIFIGFIPACIYWFCTDDVVEYMEKMKAIISIPQVQYYYFSFFLLYFIFVSFVPLLKKYHIIESLDGLEHLLKKMSTKFTTILHFLIGFMPVLLAISLFEKVSFLVLTLLLLSSLLIVIFLASFLTVIEVYISYMISEK